MSIFSTIIRSLEMPDSQDRDWYAWASNQCSHALFGVFIALLFNYAIFVTLAVATLKELVDIYKVPSKATVIDSSIDIAFWLFGAITVLLPILGMLLIFASLLTGIAFRIRNAKKVI